MSNEYYKIFPTTIGKYWYNENDRTKSQILPLLDSTTDKFEFENGIHYFDTKLNAFDQRELIELKNFVLAMVNRYAKEVLNITTNMIVAGAWINKTHKGFSQKIHNHGNSYLSATYYLCYNNNIHSSICFYNNKEGESKMPYLYSLPNEINEYNTMGFSFTDIKEGDLLVWPSYLQHGFDKNEGDDRISISMNFLPEYINNGNYSLKIIKP